MVEIKRRKGESFLDYADRLITNRKDYDLDYTEVYDLLFGKIMASDNCRKNLYGVKDLIDALKSEGVESIESSELIDKFEQARIEAEKEKIKASDQKREYRKIVREIARVEGMKEYIQQSARDIAKEKPLKFEKVDCTNNFSSDEAVMLFGDFHFGLEVDNFLNVYNKNVFIERVQKYVSETIYHCKRHNVRVVHVCDLSDNISGNIHVTTRVLNNEDVITQIQTVSEVISEVLAKLSNEFDFVHYHSVIDNHSRCVAKKSESLDTENFSKLTPWYLKSRLSEVSNIIIHDNKIDDSIASLDVCGYLCYAVHGHQDNINNVVQNLSLMTKNIPNYCFMGHGHHSNELDVHSVKVICNPSGVGSDHYSNQIRKSSEAEQKLLIFNEKDGRYATYNIKLQ